MNLKKHKQELASRMELLDTPADNQLAFELIELHEKKCTVCQEDRLGCTVRPACMNRNFLNALIEIGVNPQDLPAFCYSQHLEQIRRFILDKKGREMTDRRIPIKDLLSTLGVSSIRHFTTKFKKEWKGFSSAHEENVLIVKGDSLIFHFDFARGIVTLNPRNDRLENFEVFNLYCQIFSNYYGLKTIVTDLTINWWLLSIEIEGHSLSSVKSQLKAGSLKGFDAVYTSEIEDLVKIHAEVIAGDDSSSLEVGQLRDLFIRVSKFEKQE
ncbi:MAG: hypothetical protein AM326_12635 [Candidatus Thorarchaeota archaeon SMTZ-45]|nr:MAG: hypothetical protein AM325_10820 [Candidatus Thorarchaeota archaeon SMTZ1-45]KXH76975.1 MAG: hypothetical protein AM326_12635 [Candidatus Thorarchaeota archaeon SMTZ-45]